MAAEPEELGEEKKKKAKKPTDRLGFPRKIIAACVLAPRRGVRVSLLGHHFFAGWPLLLLLEAGRRPSHRKASVPQFLNDVPEYIQFQKFEFGVYSELSVIESIHHHPYHSPTLIFKVVHQPRVSLPPPLLPPW